jgi:hypothetical protein
LKDGENYTRAAERVDGGKSGYAGALKVGNLLSAEADAELSPGHARDQLIVRGHGPLLHKSIGK